jgi:murein DD-endopeptidase MepM/ murein hydrolase activator NlpD
MMKSVKTFRWLLFLFLISLFITCDEKINSPEEEINSPEEEISMITPFKDISDMSAVNDGFSSTAEAPWGFVHNGIDFFPDGNLKPFQAVSSGRVEDVKLWQNDKTLNWQVNIRIKYNNTFSVEYAFEPMSQNESDGQTQLENIYVTSGQNLSQGEIIGKLFVVADAAHVHFGLYKDGNAICPEPYFTPEAREAILTLLHNVFPGANMCY